MTNFLIGIVIGGVLASIISQIQRKLDRNQIDRLEDKNKKLSKENYALKTENSRYKVFISTINDRVVMLEERGGQIDTWFGSLLRHNPQQPFSKEIIKRLIAENKIFDDT